MGDKIWIGQQEIIRKLGTQRKEKERYRGKNIYSIVKYLQKGQNIGKQKDPWGINTDLFWEEEKYQFFLGGGEGIGF